MREKIQRGGVFYSQQGQPLNFLDSVQKHKSLLWLNIPSIRSRRSSIPGSSVVYNFLNFIFFFSSNKVRWWGWEV